MDLRIHVGRGQAEDEQIAPPDAVPAELAVLHGKPADEVLRRGVLPEHFVQRLVGAAAAALEGQRELVVDEHEAERVADPVGGGLLRRRHDDEQVDNDLVVGQPARMGNQAGRHVGTWLGALGLDQILRPGEVALVGGIGLLRDVE
jgi:hypothetical protein